MNAPWFASLRERAWVWLANFAKNRANRLASLHHGLNPYALLIPVREQDVDVDCDVWPANSQEGPRA